MLLSTGMFFRRIFVFLWVFSLMVLGLVSLGFVRISFCFVGFRGF